jgi:hypothetical protein
MKEHILKIKMILLIFILAINCSCATISVRKSNSHSHPYDGLEQSAQDWSILFMGGLITFFPSIILIIPCATVGITLNALAGTILLPIDLSKQKVKKQ